MAKLKKSVQGTSGWKIMISYRNEYDVDGSCSNNGANAEQEFISLLRSWGDSVDEATLEKQYDHIDLDSIRHGSFDVKARKRISRGSSKAQDELVWVEFNNVAGKNGWLIGNADYIVFERENDFVCVPRSDLLELCYFLVDLNDRVDSPKEALYKSYTRRGRKDVISIIKMSDVLHLPETFMLDKK